MTITRSARFDTDALVAACRTAVTESEPRLAVKEVLAEVVHDADGVADVLRPTLAGITPLYSGDDVTVLHVVWAPGMRFRPHNHLMWAAIALYQGQEDNTFYRRVGASIAASGGRQLRETDVALLGDDTIHAVHNPRQRLTGAIHVYGGDLIGIAGRSEWDEDDDLAEIPYDFDRTRRFFETFN